MATIDTLCSRYPPWRSSRNSGPAAHPLINSQKTAISTCSSSLPVNSSLGIETERVSGERLKKD